MDKFLVVQLAWEVLKSSYSPSTLYAVNVLSFSFSFSVLFFLLPPPAPNFFLRESMFCFYFWKHWAAYLNVLNFISINWNLPHIISQVYRFQNWWPCPRELVLKGTHCNEGPRCTEHVTSEPEDFYLHIYTQEVHAMHIHRATMAETEFKLLMSFATNLIYPSYVCVDVELCSFQCLGRQTCHRWSISSVNFSSIGPRTLLI